MAKVSLPYKSIRWTGPPLLTLKLEESHQKRPPADRQQENRDLIPTTTRSSVLPVTWMSLEMDPPSKPPKEAALPTPWPWHYKTGVSHWPTELRDGDPLLKPLGWWLSVSSKNQHSGWAWLVIVLLIQMLLNNLINVILN